MKRRGHWPPRPAGEGRTAVEGEGSARLRAALRGLGRALRAEVAAPEPDDPQPATEWGKRADERLRAVEQQLANQNRILLFSLVAIVADVIAKVVTH